VIQYIHEHFGVKTNRHWKGRI